MNAGSSNRWRGHIAPEKNAFLGVLMPEVELLAAPSLKRGRRFDWLYEQLVTTGRLKSVLSESLGLPNVVWHRLRSETDHELRAALICLLTAALAAARRQSSAKLKAAGSGCHRGHCGNRGRQKDFECCKKDGVKGDFRSGPTTPPLNAFGVLQNHPQAVRKIIFTQRVEDIQNTAYGDGLPKVPSV